MLLVMSTAGIFHNDDSESSVTTADRNYTALWQVTWERIDCFLPNLKRDLFLNRTHGHSPTTSNLRRKPSDGEELIQASPAKSLEDVVSDDIENVQTIQG